MLPAIAIGVGIALIVLFLITRMRTTGGAQVMPAYNNYQSNFGPTEADRAFNVDSVGYTMEGAIPAAPVCDTAKGDCNYATASCGGAGKNTCWESDAVNFAPDASKCQCIGCCVRKRYGCLDRANRNFNPWANSHDQRFCAQTPKCNPTPVVAADEPVGIAVTGAQVMPFEGGCFAPYDTPLLGGIKSCGNDWDLNDGNRIGAVSY